MINLMLEANNVNQAAAAAPERAQRVSACTKITNSLKSAVSLSGQARDAVASTIATAAISATKGLFSTLPSSFQNIYEDHCLSQARKYSKKILETRPAVALLGVVENTAIGSAAKTFAQSVAEFQKNPAVQLGISLVDWIRPGTSEAVLDPMKPILKENVVPLIKCAHEFLAKQALTSGCSMAINALALHALKQSAVGQAVINSHEGASKALLYSEVALGLYIYGPTLFEVGSMTMSAIDAYDQVTSLKNMLSTPASLEEATKIAEKFGVQGVTPDLILQAAAFLLLSGKCL